MWQEFSSCNTDENERGTEKTKGLGGKTHTKSYAPNYCPSLWLTTILHVSSFEPTLVHITHRPMSSALAMNIGPRQQPQQARKTKNQRRRTEVCFSLQPTVFSIFLPTTDSRLYNIVLFFPYGFFSRKFYLTTFVFNTPSFSFSFWFVFSSFLGFFQIASFTFLSLCIFVSISNLPLEILCLVQYRTALNKGK